jgi:23S rRNA G2069 N7-methylase RlmK/C1962 C5-methylase RlmI
MVNITAQAASALALMLLVTSSLKCWHRLHVSALSITSNRIHGLYGLHLRQQYAASTSSKLYSLAEDTSSSSSIDEDDDEYEYYDDQYSKKYVIIRKNRQSMAFRNGSPLVYSGSVKRTIQIGGQIDPEEHKLEMGSLVGIVVSNEKDESPKKKTYGRRARGKQATEVKYNHDFVDKETNVVTSYTMEGNLISSKDGTRETESEISTGKLIGYGFFNPISMYRVFIFCHQTSHPALFKSIKNVINENGGEIDTTEKALELVLRSKVNDAIRARNLQGLPSPSTDSYRLVNGEGDGLSGLALDIIGGSTAVIMASAAWCELYRETVMRVIDDVLKTDHPIYSKAETPLELVWRNTPMRLKQDGYILEEDSASDADTDTEKESTPVVITENGIKYNTFPYDVTSQKTGFYCDQRDNRSNLAQFCKGKKVLDLCCYTGGFALNAMIHGGAASSVGVDSSQTAITAAEENRDLNGVSSSLSFVKADIGQYMKEADESGDEFDVIILDPPKLAPTIKQLDRASRKYHSLNRDAMKLINKKEGGLLLTCSCSGAMTQKNGGQFFLETIQGAALSAGRRITLLSTSGAAPCHTQDPASFPANAYLTAALFSVSPLED